MERTIRPGEIDAMLAGEAAQAFAELLEDALREVQTDTLVIDLAGVTRIGSVAIGAILAANEKLCQRGGHLRIVGVTQELCRQLGPLQLEKLIAGHIDGLLTRQVIRPSAYATALIGKPAERFIDELAASYRTQDLLVVIDLEGVESVSSLTLGAILAAHERLARAGRMLRIVGVNENLRRALGRLDLESLIDES